VQKNNLSIAVTLAMAFTALAVGQKSQAQDIVIGANNIATPGGDFSPLGSGTYTISNTQGTSPYRGYYFQVYSSAFFTGPVTITSVGFASMPGTSGTYGDTFTLSEGVTASNPNNLYVGTDYIADINELNASLSSTTVVFTGTITAPLSGSGSPDFIIPVTPFTYNPSLGNLLLDFNITGSTGSSTPADFESTTFTESGDGLARYYQSPAGEEGNGLVTYFGIATTPEPSPIAVVAAGMAMLGALALVRKKRIA